MPPAAGRPAARAPEARAPEARAPEARAPEARAPEARAPEARAGTRRPLPPCVGAWPRAWRPPLPPPAWRAGRPELRPPARRGLRPSGAALPPARPGSRAASSRPRAWGSTGRLRRVPAGLVRRRPFPAPPAAAAAAVPARPARRPPAATPPRRPPAATPVRRAPAPFRVLGSSATEPASPSTLAADKRRGPLDLSRAALFRHVRRRPTLPRGPPRSTIGAEGLNFRVRNGTGCFPFAITAETLLRCDRPRRRAPGPGPPGACAVLARGTTPWPRRADRISGAAQWTQTKCKVEAKPLGLLVPVSCTRCRASTSGLSTQSSSWGPYLVNPEGDLILRRASRLDAFSGYPFRT